MSISFQLKQEAVERDRKVSELEAECSGLKDRLSQSEVDHKTAIAEHERKFLQLSEEMGNKTGEVKQVKQLNESPSASIKK